MKTKTVAHGSRQAPIAGVIVLLILLAGCDLPFWPGNSGDLLRSGLITESLTGGSAEASSTAFQSARVVSPQDDDAFWNDMWYEYAELIVVPEVAYNYNGRFGADSWVMEDIEELFTSASSSRGAWQDSPVAGMSKEMDFSNEEGRFYTNDEQTHYMQHWDNDPDAPTDTQWIEVEETAEFTRTRWLQEFAYDSIDMIEITETSDYVFTKSIRLFDRFDGAGSVADTVSVQVFGGIHRSDDPEEQLLGIRTWYDIDTTTSPWTVTEQFYANQGDARTIAAFDLTQLMIRPSVADYEASVLQFPGGQFSTRALASSQDNGQWREYDQAIESGGDAVGPQDGETLEEAEFVTPETVMSFLKSGVQPEDILAVNILAIPFDDLPESGVLELPDWDPGDLNTSFGS